jgi:hypothetical protein
VACANDDPAHCGPGCAACGGQAPACAGGACTCDATSCGDYYACVAGACELCNDAGACGASCAPCGGGSPLCAADGSGCVQCLDDSVCAADEHCQAGSCVPDCQVQGCSTDMAPAGDRCTSPKIVGRTNALSGFLTFGDTTGAGSNDEIGSCWDAKYDEFYRIWLEVGDTIAVTASPQEFDFDLTLKIYTGTVCDSEATLITCQDGASDGKAETYTHAAVVAGWHTIVVDGEMAFDSDYDWGEYSIHVALTCTSANCCCP